MAADRHAEDLSVWIAGMRRIAGVAGAPAPPRDGDATSATPFLVKRGVLSAPDDRPERPDPDAALWWAVVARDPAAGARVIGERDTPRGAGDAGSIFPQGLYTAIEVWTESDLSALQALWWLSREAGGDGLRTQMLTAARWHLDNTQPDNATNRPWGVPVFLELAARDANPDARLFAETLVHNAMATNGTPEPFSAQILLDASDALEALTREDA